MTNALSRIEAVEAIHNSLDYHQLAQDQASSGEIQAFHTLETALVLQDEDFDGVSVLCDVSTGTRWPLVPLGWRKNIFERIHGLSHAGPRPTAKAIA